MADGEALDMGDDEKDGMRNVYSLGLVSFFTDVSSEMVLSLLPVFILGLPGSSRATLGLIEGTAEALSYGLRAVSGYFSDRFRKRKIIILAGYAISNIVKPLFSAATTTTHALTIRVADRVGKGVRTAPRDALISDSASKERIGTAFGLHRTMDQLGAILGPVIASMAMLFYGMTVRSVFLLSLIPGTLALLVILFLVEERTGPEGVRFRLLEGLGRVLSREYKMLLVVVALFSLGAFNFSFILLNARDMGIGDAYIPIVYALVNVTHTAVAIPAGALSDWIGKEKTLVLGYGVFLVNALLLSALPGGVSSAFLLAAVFGLYAGIVETVQRALIPGYTISELKGTAYGLYYLVVGSAFFVSNAMTGYFWELYGCSAVSLYSVGTSALGIIGILAFLRYTKK